MSAGALAAVPATLSSVPFQQPIESDLPFLVLAAAIGVLLLCAVFFAITAGVLRYRNLRKARDWTGREEKWRSPLLDVVADMAPPEQLWDRVEEGEELYFVDFLLRYARRLRGSARSRLSDLAAPYLGDVVERMAGGDPERRARAVETVALLGFEKYGNLVVRSLEDESPLVTMVAARNIARNHAVEHAPMLLRHMVRLREWSPRQLAALLASMGAEVAPALREALEDVSRPSEIRVVAAEALHRLRDPESADIAAVVVPMASDPELVAAALRLLATLGRPEHAPLVRMFCDADDPIIRAAAYRALATTGTHSDHPLLQSALEDDAGWVAIQAAQGLVETGGADALQSFIRTGHVRSDLARQVLTEAL